VQEIGGMRCEAGQEFLRWRLWCTICGMTKRSYKIGHSREQVSPLPPCLEDYVGRDNPVRAIDAYVDSLDLNALDFCDVGSDGGAGLLAATGVFALLGGTVWERLSADRKIIADAQIDRARGLSGKAWCYGVHRRWFAGPVSGNKGRCRKKSVLKNQLMGKPVPTCDRKPRTVVGQ
jgi:hypothetical protein